MIFRRFADRAESRLRRCLRVFSSRARPLPCLGVYPRLLLTYMHSRINSLLAVGLSAALASPMLAHTVLLHDTFADGSRTNQALPASAQWTYSGPNLQPRAASLIRYTSGDELQLIRGAPAQPSLFAAYFTPQNAPQTLADGDSISLSFTLRLGSTPNSADAFRFGLFNSMGATRPTADMTLSTTNASDSRFLTAQGYSVWMNVGATAPANFNLYKRDQTSASIPFNGAANQLLGPNNQELLGYPLNQKVRHSLVITRQGNSLVMIASVNDRVVSRTDTTPTNNFAFDMIGIFNASGMLTSAALPAFYDDFVVEYRPAGGGDAGRVELLRDEFNDGDRKNQALPTSAQWFFKGSNTAPQTPDTQFRIPPEGFSTANENQDLILTNTGGAATLTATFTAPGVPLALGIGEAITARFSIQAQVLRNAPAGLRLALFDSQGLRPSTDFVTTDGPVPADAYANYRGYSVWLNPSPTAPSGVEFQSRTGTNPNLFDASAFTALGTAPLTSTGLAPGQFTRGSLKLTRLDANTLRVETAYNGVMRTEDVSANVFSFDTFALHVTANASDPGETLRLDEVTILHTPYTPTKVATPSTILSEDFAGNAPWSTLTSQSTGSATASATVAATGTIDAIMGVKPSNGATLAADASAASNSWSATLASGILGVNNSLSDPAFLTLAFDLKASSGKPVLVALESFNGSGERTGRLERLVYPAVPNAWQRFAFELDSMSSAGAGFDPTAPGLQVSYTIVGGTNSTIDWSAGQHEISVDNVHYARPAYYVKPSGDNNADGRTPVTAFATPAKAVSVAQAGDIILFMSDASLPERDYLIANETQINSQGIYVTTTGRPAGWITFKNYPGQRPRIQSYGWRTFGMGSNQPLYSPPVAYIEFRGLSLRGVAHTPLAESYKGQVIGAANTNGIEVQGRTVVNTPHHFRFADNVVADAAGGGIIISQSDYIQIENNVVYGNCLWTRYAGSGISILGGSAFDPVYDNYRFFIIGNEVFGNECREPWININALSDGNGIIMDSLHNQGTTITRGSFQGRTIIQNNIAYDNGGGGIHVFRADRVDVINNIAFNNNQIVSYAQIDHIASSNGLALNNIMASTDGKAVTGRSNSSIPGTEPSIYRNNLYVRGPGSPAPVNVAGDSGNVTVTEISTVFVNANAADFRLVAGSPAVNLGQFNSLVPSVDFAGYPRATDGAVDAGAYERQPIILSQPAANVAADEGQSVTLSVGALGDDVTYQWQKDGSPIAGATAASLVLSNVVPTDAGSYRVVVSTSFDSLTSDATTLVVFSKQDIWRRGYFGTTEAVGDAAKTADPDGDGLSNLAEYALGTDPLQPNHGAATPSLVTVTGSRYLAVTYSRDPAATGVSVAVEASGDLINWSALDLTGSLVVSESVNGSLQTKTVRDSEAIGTGVVTRFLRVSVTETPAGEQTNLVPVGHLQTPAPANTDTPVSNGLTRPAVYTGEIQARTNSVLTVTGAPGWTSGQWANNSTQGGAYVRFLSGSLRGHYLAVTANTGDTLTLDAAGLDLASAQPGDRLELVPFWTLGSLYPASSAGSAFVTSASALVRQTELMLFDHQAIGVGRAPTSTYYFASGAWRKVGAAATASFNHVALPPDTYLIHRNKATPTSVARTGQVSLGVQSSIIDAVADRPNDNYIALNYPVAVTLANSGLAAVTSTSGDRIELYKLTESGFSRRPTDFYIFDGTHWRKPDAPAEVQDNVVLRPGEGFVLRKAPGAAQIWTFTSSP